jgi:hypothetical protein
VGNAYAANQEVNTAKPPQTFVDVTPNRVLNISSIQDRKFVQTKSLFNKANVSLKFGLKVLELCLLLG